MKIEQDHWRVLYQNGKLIGLEDAKTGQRHYVDGLTHEQVYSDKGTIVIYDDDEEQEPE